MKSETYWDQIETTYNKVNIYDGPEIFLRDYKELKPFIGDLLSAHWMISEFLNGGLLQFFINPTGVLAPEAVLAFQRIGLSEISAVIQQAMDYFGDPYPRFREERVAIIAKKTGFGPDEISDLFNDSPFEELDEKLDMLGNNDFEKVNNIMDEYALKNS